MVHREKFGKFILLEEIETLGLGSEYRAAKLSATGLEKIMSVLRLSPAVSGNVEVARLLMEQAKLAAQLQNPNIVKIYGIGKVEAVYYISYEFIEGKSLRSIFNRCRQERFPFSIDHTLLIASKICSALEYAHARKSDSGSRYFHGLLNPSAVKVSYEGEVRANGFGYWPSRIREAGGINEEESLYLSPEQAAGGPGDTRSDTFAVGAILFETLTSQPFFQNGRNVDVASRIAGVKLQNPSGEVDSLPKPIAEILSRALSLDPKGRYAEVQEMRKAIDTLLFSGDFTPTTFNLAFFMHSLFREDIEKESKTLKGEKEANYIDFLSDDLTKTKPPSSTPVAPRAAAPVAHPVPHPAPHPPAHKPDHAADRTPEPLVPHRETKTPVPVAASAPSHAEEPAPGLSSSEAAAGFTFHKDEPKSKKGLIAAVVALVVIAGAGAAYYLKGGLSVPVPTPPPPSTMSPEAAAAAVTRVKELEAKLKEIDDEKAAAEQKAKDEAEAKLRKEAKARGAEVDAVALQKAQEEAAKKARAEQERKQEEERRKLEEQKRLEEARLAEEAKRAEEVKKAAEAATPPPPAPPPATAPPEPAVKAGALVNLNDPGVLPPVPEGRPPNPRYPPIAFNQKIEGTVELNILVDDKGSVVDATVVSGPPGNAGFTEAAIESVKKRKYRPATKDGTPVKVWMPVRVTFAIGK